MVIDVNVTRRVALVIGVLPFVVGAIALIVGTGSDYRPISDHALTEMQVRDVVGGHTLTGLYSRDDWAHPGPMLALIATPAYWLSGKASISLNVVALAINAVAVAGMAWFARRRGDTPAMLCTLAGCVLVMRTMEASFLNDPWNNSVVTLPFGLLLFCTWSLLCGDELAAPVGVVTASFLAQTHVGFVALALPLLALGLVVLVVRAIREDDADRQWAYRRSLIISGVIGAVLWVPTLIDTLFREPANLGRILNYFRTSDDPSHTFGEGWRIVTGQFNWPPEWLYRKRTDLYGFGESPFRFDRGVPIILVAVVLAAVWLVVRKRNDAGLRQLGIVFGCAVVIGIVSIMRTLGPLLEYRLRWTWMVALTGFVFAATTLWFFVRDRFPSSERRVLVPIAMMVIVVGTAVNTVDAVTTGTPWSGDSEVLKVLMPQIRPHVERDGGQVVLSDVYSNAAWYTRGIALQLERAGIDARVPAERGIVYGRTRVYDPDEPAQAFFVVVKDLNVEQFLENPDFGLVALWQPPDGTSLRERIDRRLELMRESAEGKITFEEFVRQSTALKIPEPPEGTASNIVGVFQDLRPRPEPFL